jgi:hypothetical protein
VRSSFDLEAPPEADAVFVDRTGRRRWLVVAVAVWLAVALIGAIVLLIAALTGSSRVPVPGLPGADRHPVVRGEAGAVHPSPPRRLPSSPPSVPPESAPAPSTAAARSASPSPSPTGPPGHRRTAHPGNPKPSRSR